MKFVAPRSSLLSAIERVRNVVERRSTVPILSNLRISCVKGELEIIGTDLDMELTARTQVSMERHGACTVPASLLHDILRKLPDKAEVTFEQPTINEAVTLRAGRARFALPTLPVADFPDLPGPHEHAVAIEIGCDTLAKMIARVDFSISTEETRYYLNGIYLHAADGMLRAVATNGHTLGWFQTSVPAPEALPGIILPRKACAEIRRMSEGSQNAAKLEISAEKVRLTIDDVQLVTKVIDGTFPDYLRIIPQPASHLIEVEAGELSAAAARVSAVSSARSKAVKLTFGYGACSLFVRDPEGGGDAEDSIAITYEGGHTVIGFNADYIAAICSASGGGKLSVSITEPMSLALIRVVGDESFLGLVMPMSV